MSKTKTLLVYWHATSTTSLTLKPQYNSIHWLANLSNDALHPSAIIWYDYKSKKNHRN